MKQYIKDAMIALAAWPFAVLLWPVLYMIGATKKREMDAKVLQPDKRLADALR